MMKKVLVMLLMSTLGLSQTMADNHVKEVSPVILSGTRASSFSGGTGTEADPYLISTPEDLVQLSKDIIKDNTHGMMYENKFFKMTNDIDMSAITDFEPIGNNHHGNLKAFLGTFDGNNHTIRGLNMAYKGVNFQGIGLFGVAQAATIKNIRIEDSKFLGDGMVAPILAVAVSTTIQNCHVGKNVYSTAPHIGGAGICSFVMGGPSLIEDCSSAATVSADGFGASAGILASVSDGGKGTIVRRCVNYGNVDVITESAGGIIAFPQEPCIIEDCANFGNISSGTGASGISYICPNPQPNHLIINNCYNVGKVYGGDPAKVDPVSLGVIFVGGGDSSCVVKNCYNDSIRSEATSVSAVNLTSEDLKSLDIVKKLNNGRADGPWRINLGSEDGYPVPFDYVLPTGIENVTVNESSAAISYNAGFVTASGVKAGEKFFVVDMSGRTVKAVSAQKAGELTIDVTSLPAGVYVIGNGSSSIKIVK